MDMKRRGKEFGVIYFLIAVFKFTLCSILSPTLSKALEFPWQLWVDQTYTQKIVYGSKRPVLKDQEGDLEQRIFGFSF